MPVYERVTSQSTISRLTVKRTRTANMATPSAMIQAVILGLLVVSTVFADDTPLNKNEKRDSYDVKSSSGSTFVSEKANFPFANPSSHLINSKSLGSSTPAPFAFDGSFSTTAAPFKSVSYSSTPAPFAYGNSFLSNSYSNAAPLKSVAFGSSPAAFGLRNSFSSNVLSNSGEAQSFDGAFVSSSPLYDGSFASSTPAPFVGSSTPATFNDESYGSSTPASLIGSSTPGSYFSGAAVSDASFGYSAAPASVFSGGFAPVVSSTPEPVHLDRSPAFATSYGSYFSGAYAPSYSQGAITKTESASHDAVEVAAVQSHAPAPHHEITITKEVPVPYYVQVEKRVPYPVLVRVPHPYPVTVERHVPYAVKVNVDRPVHVPQPYPVEVEKRVPYPVEKPVPYEVKVPVDRPYPVHVPVEKPVPYAVEKPVPYPVRVNVDRPYPVEKPVPYPVHVEKPVPYPVEKRVPYPVEKLVPYPVEKKVPYPVRYEVPVKVPVPVEVRVPVSVDRPVPYPVEKRVPYPVQVPVEVKVPVPVAAPAQRFATVHYYQQSPVAVGYESSQAIGGQSGYKAFASQSFDGVPNVYYNTPANAVILNNQNLKTPEQLALTGTKFSYSGAAPAAYGNAFYSSTSSPSSFYSSTSSPASFYSSTSAPISSNVFSSTASPINSYSSTAGPAGFFGSNVVQEGFASSSSAPYNFGQQSFFGSSTPAPFDLFSAGSGSADASSLFKSTNYGSVGQQTVDIGGVSSKVDEKVESKTDDSNVVKK